MDLDTPLVARDNMGGGYTWDDFLALDDEARRELIEGELIELEITNQGHEWIVTFIVFRLMGWAYPIRAGRVYGSGYKVRITNRRGVMPDVQFYRHGNKANFDEQGVTRGRPELAVEIISPSSVKYDRVTKLQWYADVGVPEYWVIDKDARMIERFLLKDGTCSAVGGAKGDAVFAPDTFPGLEISLAESWRKPDDD